jgi:hypothetical protein
MKKFALLIGLSLCLAIAGCSAAKEDEDRFDAGEILSAAILVTLSQESPVAPTEEQILAELAELVELAGRDLHSGLTVTVFMEGASPFGARIDGGGRTRASNGMELRMMSAYKGDGEVTEVQVRVP